MTIGDWLKDTAKTLSDADIDSARLDAELILSHTIRKPRTYLHAHSEEKLSPRHEDIANARIQLRLDRTPIAYIVGHKEFYGRRFMASPAALIPRPETEALIDLFATTIPQTLPFIKDKRYIVDVGTGTGAIGITVKKEWPDFDVTLTDTSNQALQLARKNADLLEADVHFFRGDLLHGYTTPVDTIIANLPYVDKSWTVSPDVHSEPELALYAPDQGLALIRRLIAQAAHLLRPGGTLLLESDERQHSQIIQEAVRHNLTHQTTEGLAQLFVKKP